ncbi:hypothetical protein Patl1_04661 [Pistacia atlantica]|uniref:Uncharacterized protein n=1 Tax=Pistacia atlantica TaxID=434234 RepID=A0ACC1BTP4_9ROSI|nr:hypothetical protein Patl1_04661 [Pistacia atlantica]
MLKLTDNGKFDGVGHPTTLPGIEFLKPNQFQIFGSSKSAIDDIIEALKNDKIYMVGLYGMGGAGKTTLAKEVGNRVKEIFNEVVMVTISQTPNFKNIQGQLASELRLSLLEQGEEETARRLFKRFTEPEKKILVILDDVWRKFELKSILGIPLDDDNKNCKILLTTRRQQVCIDMGCQSRIQLNVLNDDEAVALLKRHAGIGDASTLNPLAIKIAKECDGLPLALVAIGSALREKDSDEWKQRGREANPNPNPSKKNSRGGKDKSVDVIASMEARVMRNEVNVAEVKEHLDVLDQKMDDVEGMVETMGEFRQHVADKHQAFEEFQVVVLDSLRTLQAQVEELRSGLEESKGDWAFCKRAVANGVVTNAAPPARVEVPRPRKYGGKRDAQELENFLWSMERYFEATNVQSEQERVNIATGYLEDHAIAWWQRKHAEIMQGTCIINTWELLKCEIKKQFYPGNVAYEARKKMRELKHTGPISRYVDEFSKLMLQVDNMNSEDLLFNFMEGLQPWAQRELQRRQVANISTALTEADTLVEFRKERHPSRKRMASPITAKVGEERETNHPTEKGDKPPHKKEWRKDGKKEYKRRENCYLCDGDHWIREFFKDMKALQVVTLIDVDPMSFKSLELLTNLQSLKLKGCKLRDISFLGKLTRLKVLELEGSSLAGEWPKELGDQLSELRVLDVRHSKLRIPRDGLRRFSQLEELYADSCFFWPSDEITSAEESWATVCELNSLSCLVTLSLQINNKCLPNGFAFPKLERYVINVPSFVGIVRTGYKRSLRMFGIEAASLIAFEELSQNVQSLYLSHVKGLQNYFPSVDQTCFSELIYLESGSCEELKCIIDTSQRQAPAAAFSNLKTLILSDMSHLEEIYKGAEPPNTFLEKLETVKMSGCHSMCNVYPPMLLQRLHQLKKAEIISCNKLSEVFKLEGLCQTEGENSAVLSSLESLMLWNLPELRFIWKGPIRLVSFKNLAHVEVIGCSNLKNLFALSIVRRLVQLEELIISDCGRLEHIVSDYNQGDEIAEIENGKNIVLPKLIKLRLQKLPKLISFCSENYYSTCPILQLLEVDGCPKWTTPIIVEANMQDPPEFRHLQDCNDDVIPGTLVHGLQNLEGVKLIGCAVQVVFQLEGVVAERRKHKLSFPRLKNLKLKFLEKLEGLCMGLSLTHVPSLQNLTYLEVDSCSRLRYIFSATLARNMMQLKYLHISNCAELEQIIVVEEEEYQAFLNNNLQPDTFRNILEVEVKSCSKLKCLFPTTIARGLQQLEVLVVEHNFQLEEVFGHKEVAGIMEDEEIVLPRLNYLRLRALPSLTNFCPEGCHFIFPSLRKLKFQDCGATVPIFSLTGDECVHADEKKLRVLRIRGCNNLCGGISLFSCGFNNLEYLSIWNCGVQVVFQLGDVAVDGQSHQLTHIFSPTFARNMLQLKILSVADCMELQQIVVEDDDDDDHPQSLFPNLSEINVKWCDKLKCVIPITMARDLQQLKVVTVAWANQLEEVFGHTDRVDVMTDNEIQLPQLDRLYLKDLPNLANFCPIGYHFIFPSLNTLIVERCPEMNTAFSSNQQNEFVHAEAQVLF